MRRRIFLAAATALLVAGTAGAQTRPAPATPQDLRNLQAALQLRESRYQIGQMERVLEGAVEHGANVIRDRLAGLMPADMLLTEDARARGFRLDGYGVFFDVEVPSLEGTLPWSYRTLDQNNLGIANALQTLRAFVAASAANDVNLQQAMKRIELQVAPFDMPALAAGGSSGAAVTTATVRAAADPAPVATPPPPPDPILSDPNEAYRTQIREALIDAMLEHSRGLNVTPTEMLTVAARRSDDRPRLALVDTEARTVVISMRGSDLAAYLAGQMTRDEAHKRVDVRVF